MIVLCFVVRRPPAGNVRVAGDEKPDSQLSSAPAAQAYPVQHCGHYATSYRMERSSTKDKRLYGPVHAGAPGLRHVTGEMTASPSLIFAETCTGATSAASGMPCPMCTEAEPLNRASTGKTLTAAPCRQDCAITGIQGHAKRHSRQSLADKHIR